MAGLKEPLFLSALARALLLAGVCNLLVSHWPIRANVAVRLTADTIQKQAADTSLSRVKFFQQATRTICNDVSHVSALDAWAQTNA